MSHLCAGVAIHEIWRLVLFKRLANKFAYYMHAWPVRTADLLRRAKIRNFEDFKTPELEGRIK